MTPWSTLATVATAEGALELRQRGDREFLIVIDGRVLMTSNDRRSEQALATLACEPVAAGSPRVLIGGLGMAYTVRAALDAVAGHRGARRRGADRRRRRLVPRARSRR